MKISSKYLLKVIYFGLSRVRDSLSICMCASIPFSFKGGMRLF